MILKRTKNKGFTAIDNTPLQDSSVSFKARGMLAYLLSKPDTWEVSIEDLMNNSPKEGKDSIRAGMKELATIGCAVLRKTRDAETKRMVGERWFVSDDSEWIAQISASDEILLVKDETNRYTISSRRTDFPASDFPEAGKPDINKRKKEEKKDSSPRTDKRLEVIDQAVIDQGVDNIEGTWQWKASKWMLDWFRVNKYLAGILKKVDDRTIIAGSDGKDGWWHVVDKLHRIDGHEQNKIAMVFKWIRDTAEDVNSYGDPINGAWWLRVGNWSSLGSLRSKKGGELTQFDKLYAKAKFYNDKQG